MPLDYPHIVCRTGRESLGGECLRCGEAWSMKLPVSARVWVAASKAFFKQHKDCREKKALTNP
jgi:hypothetical protein